MLTIELDRPDRTYAAGELVEGRVRAHVRRPMRCDGLVVSVEVHTHGKGNPGSATGASVELFRGEWVPDEHAYEFSLPTPKSVRLYSGELVNVGFRVVATADVPWAIDPRVEEEIAVVHPPADSLRVTWDERAFQAGHATWGRVALLGILACALGAGMLAVGSTSSSLEDLAGCSIPVFMIGGFAALMTGRRWLAERKLGAVGLRLAHEHGESYRARDGGLTCRVQVKPSAPVRGAHAQLVVRETATRGSGSNRTTETHELFESYADLALEEPGLYLARLELPVVGSTPYSFRIGDSGVEWLVAVRVEIDGWPDWSETIKLTAAP